MYYLWIVSVLLAAVSGAISGEGGDASNSVADSSKGRSLEMDLNVKVFGESNSNSKGSGYTSSAERLKALGIGTKPLKSKTPQELQAEKKRLQAANGQQTQLTQKVQVSQQVQQPQLAQNIQLDQKILLTQQAQQPQLAQQIQVAQQVQQQTQLAQQIQVDQQIQQQPQLAQQIQVDQQIQQQPQLAQQIQVDQQVQQPQMVQQPAEAQQPQQQSYSGIDATIGNTARASGRMYVPPQPPPMMMPAPMPAWPGPLPSMPQQMFYPQSLRRPGYQPYFVDQNNAGPPLYQAQPPITIRDDSLLHETKKRLGSQGFIVEEPMTLDRFLKYQTEEQTKNDRSSTTWGRQLRPRGRRMKQKRQRQINGIQRGDTDYARWPNENDEDEAAIALGLKSGARPKTKGIGLSNLHFGRSSSQSEWPGKVYGRSIFEAKQTLIVPEDIARLVKGDRKRPVRIKPITRRTTTEAETEESVSEEPSPKLLPSPETEELASAKYSNIRLTPVDPFFSNFKNLFPSPFWQPPMSIFRPQLHTQSITMQVPTTVNILPPTPTSAAATVTLTPMVTTNTTKPEKMSRARTSRRPMESKETTESSNREEDEVPEEEAATEISTLTTAIAETTTTTVVTISPITKGKTKPTSVNTGTVLSKTYYLPANSNSSIKIDNKTWTQYKDIAEKGIGYRSSLNSTTTFQERSTKGDGSTQVWTLDDKTGPKGQKIGRSKQGSRVERFDTSEAAKSENSMVSNIQLEAKLSQKKPDEDDMEDFNHLESFDADDHNVPVHNVNYDRFQCDCCGSASKDSSILSTDHRVIRVGSLTPLDEESGEAFAGPQSWNTKNLIQKLTNSLNFGPKGTVKLAQFEFEEINLAHLPSGKTGRELLRRRLAQTDILVWSQVDTSHLREFASVIVRHIMRRKIVALLILQREVDVEFFGKFGYVAEPFEMSQNHILVTKGPQSGPFGEIPAGTYINQHQKSIRLMTHGKIPKVIVKDEWGYQVGIDDDNCIVLGDSFITENGLINDETGSCVNNPISIFYCNLFAKLIQKVEIYRTERRYFVSHSMNKTQTILGSVRCHCSQGGSSLLDHQKEDDDYDDKAYDLVGVEVKIQQRSILNKMSPGHRRHRHFRDI